MSCMSVFKLDSRILEESVIHTFDLEHRLQDI